MRLGRHAESIGPMGIKPIPKKVRRTASRWSAPRLRWPHREFTKRFCRRLLSFAERFKNARALEMRLFRHGGIYRSDVSSHLINLVPGSRFTVGSGPGYRTRRKNTPCPSSAMSSGRLFLDRVARQHCPSPLHRHTQINMHSSDSQAEGDISTLPDWGTFLLCLDSARLRLVAAVNACYSSASEWNSPLFDTSDSLRQTPLLT